MLKINKSILTLLIVALSLIRPIKTTESYEDFVDLDNTHHIKYKEPKDVELEKLLSAQYVNFTPPDAKEIARVQKLVEDMNEMMKHKSNWTSCEEFVNGITLDLKKLVDIDWQLYINWNIIDHGGYGTIVKFQIPTSAMIERYKSVLENDTVNWDETELILESNFEFNILLIRTDISGIYTGYFDIAVGTPYSIPIALKIVDSGYLGIMRCKDKVLAGFAPLYKFPNTPEEALETIPLFNYKSDYKTRLYLTPPKHVPKPYRGPDTRIQMSYDYGNIDSPTALTIF